MKYAPSSALMAAVVLAAAPALAQDQEVKEIFALGSKAALSFTNERAIDDISVSFMHFTRAGRASLLAEMERTGIIGQVVNNRQAAVRAEMNSSTVTANKRVGATGLDEYDMRGEMQLVWQRCEATGCVPLASPRKVQVSGVVVQVNMNGRPGYRVNSIAFVDGGSK